jgi:hypothetical protein
MELLHTEEEGKIAKTERITKSSQRNRHTIINIYVAEQEEDKLHARKIIFRPEKH